MFLFFRIADLGIFCRILKMSPRNFFYHYSNGGISCYTRVLQGFWFLVKKILGFLYERPESVSMYLT